MAARKPCLILLLAVCWGVFDLAPCLWAQTNAPEQSPRAPERFDVDAFGVTHWETAWSPDGKVIALTHDCTDGIWLHDGMTLKEIHTLDGHKGGLYSLAISPDSKVLASGGRSDKARFWDLGTGKELNLLDNNEDGVNRLAFTPDGKRLVVVDKPGVVSVWDMETRRVTTKSQRWPTPL